MDSNELIATIGVSVIAGLGPTIAGLAAFRAARANASQTSVDDLHEQLVLHTQQDEISFTALDDRGESLVRGQEAIWALLRTATAERAALAERIAALDGGAVLPSVGFGPPPGV